MKLKTLKILTGAVAIIAVASIAVARAQTPTNAIHSAPPVSQRTGTKNIEVVDVTPPNQISPRVHIIYDFDNWRAKEVRIGSDGITAEKWVTLKDDNK